MNDPILILGVLRNNLMELIANMELLFSTPVLLVDTNNIPIGSIEKIIEEWRYYGTILTYTHCEINYKIDDKY